MGHEPGTFVKVVWGTGANTTYGYFVGYDPQFGRERVAIRREGKMVVWLVPESSTVEVVADDELREFALQEAQK